MILLFFDLPALTSEDRREYNHFRKNMLKQGFLPMQESCYLKLIRNTASMEGHIASLRAVIPPRGNIVVLPMSLSEFRGMKCLLGELPDMEILTEDLICIGEEEDA